MNAFIEQAKAFAVAHPTVVACVACGLVGFIVALMVVK